MFVEHRVFLAPDDPDVPVWRYMDFPKFVSLLHRRALFFPSAARLGDPFEGSYPVANLRLRPTWYGEHEASIDEQSRADKIRRLESTLISCWHINPVESAAMWRLYAGEGCGLAVRSTYRRLTQAFQLDRPIYIGRVQYLRYDTDPMPEGNVFDPFVHKRASFSHEQELRVVTERYVAPGTVTTWEVRDGPPPYFGDYVPTDLGVLIEAVYVAPSSPAWFAETLKETAARFHLASEVRPSDLDQVPNY